MGVCVLGSLNLDIVCRVEALPRRGETVAGRAVERLPGGKGANQAVAAARCGAPTRLIGAVGRDEAGDMLLAVMLDAGVGVEGVTRLAGHATGHAFIWVSDAGENSIVVAGGANLVVGAGLVGANAGGRGDVRLAQLETPVAAIEAFFTGPGAGGGLRVLNAAPAILEARRLFSSVDILIVNETELASFAGVAVDPDDLGAIVVAARGLMTRADQVVVVTLGKDGVLAVRAEDEIRAPGRPAKAIDTTGAGDCFCGVLAARLAEGTELGEALVFANAAAALSTERPGAAPSMPLRAEVEAALLGAG